MHITTFDEFGTLVSELAARIAAGEKLAVNVQRVLEFGESGRDRATRREPADVSMDVSRGSLASPPQTGPPKLSERRWNRQE